MFTISSVFLLQRTKFSKVRRQTVRRVNENERAPHVILILVHVNIWKHSMTKLKIYISTESLHTLNPSLGNYIL